MVSVPLALIAGRADGSERSDLRHQAFGAAGGNNYGSFLAMVPPKRRLSGMDTPSVLSDTSVRL